MKYERLTREYQFDCSRCEDRKCTKDGFCCDETFCKIYNRLAELEDKIENGTLIDMPRIIHPNKAEWYVQYQYPSGVIQYYICFSEAEAEAKLKELKGE